MFGYHRGLYKEDCSLKQSKPSHDTNSEEIIKRAKKLCFQVQHGRAPKVLASDGF